MVRINVWAAIVDSHLTGPPDGSQVLDLPARGTGRVIERFPLALRQHIWFQQDGAPAHFSFAVREHLRQKFRKRWIARGGPTPSTPTSSDLTPLDSFLWAT